MTGLADDMDERKRREVSSYTIKPASDRKGKIESLINRMNKEIKNLSPQTLSDRFGITIENQLHTVKAKQIPLPQLQLGDRTSVEEGKQSNFRLFNQPLYNTKVQMKVACLAFRDFNIGSLESVQLVANVDLQEHCQELPYRPRLQGLRLGRILQPQGSGGY